MSESPTRNPRQLQEQFFRAMGGPQQFQQLFAYLADVYFFVKDAHSRMIGVNELSATAGVSSRQLHRRFVELFGLNVQEFLAFRFERRGHFIEIRFLRSKRVHATIRKAHR